MSIDKDIEGTPIAVTPSDVTEHNPRLDMIYVGGAGTIAYKFEVGGPTFTLLGIQAGSQLRIKMAQVLATGTTATGIVGFL